MFYFMLLAPVTFIGHHTSCRPLFDYLQPIMQAVAPPAPTYPSQWGSGFPAASPDSRLVVVLLYSSGSGPDVHPGRHFAVSTSGGDMLVSEAVPCAAQDPVTTPPLAIHFNGLVPTDVVPVSRSLTEPATDKPVRHMPGRQQMGTFGLPFQILTYANHKIMQARRSKRAAKIDQAKNAIRVCPDHQEVQHLRLVQPWPYMRCEQRRLVFADCRGSFSWPEKIQHKG